VASDNPEHKGELVVVGMDGSPSSKEAIRWAADQAQRTGARLEILTAWDWPQSYGWTIPVPSDYDPEADARGLVSACADEVRATHPGLDVTAATAQGHPAEVLVDASKAADLLVVGSRGHGEFAGMLLGSVSEHCTANAHCPVVVVRGDKGHSGS
jgi:nucleotide-binding universal stress UspA family protein